MKNKFYLPELTTKTITTKSLCAKSIITMAGILFFLFIVSIGSAQQDKRPGPGHGNPMEHLDKNGDQLISMEEFPGPDHHFKRFDADNDGYLDESELPKAPPKRRQNRQSTPDKHESNSVNPENDAALLNKLNTDAHGQYKIVDTGQSDFYDNFNKTGQIDEGNAFYGQDANYEGNQPGYKNNGDGTITDLNTGLMWQQDPGDKKSYAQAVEQESSFELAGYKDWRLPTIKELYSLILFNGIDSNMKTDDLSKMKPFIDTDYFNFNYGDTENGDRIIDSQYVSSTRYVSTTMNGNQTVFGVNFADGRIKGYPIITKNFEKLYYVIYVRDNPEYGKNNFTDNQDGTITDTATNLMWMKQDSGTVFVNNNKNGAMNWEQALKWAQNLEYAGYSDWRLPNAKELQSIVDYSRSPATTNSAAINPMFNVTSIIDESRNTNYPFYWTGTTHANLIHGKAAVYISFGEALGWMKFPRDSAYELLDVHGAGAQRSDPKAGNPDNYPNGRGPQGDIIRINNYVRCVRDVIK